MLYICTVDMNRAIFLNYLLSVKERDSNPGVYLMFWSLSCTTYSLYLMQVVRGVQFIHSKRILHLDLKPFNIIFANQNDDYNLREI